MGSESERFKTFQIRSMLDPRISNHKFGFLAPFALYLPKHALRGFGGRHRNIFTTFDFFTPIGLDPIGSAAK